jgi:hypothetical protein
VVISFGAWAPPEKDQELPLQINITKKKEREADKKCN